jgi:hypothetical protein
LSRGSKLRKHLYYARHRLEKALDVASDLDAGEVDSEFIGDILEKIAEVQDSANMVDEMVCRKSVQLDQEEVA